MNIDIKSNRWGKRGKGEKESGIRSKIKRFR
jgi:hypothetical protein